MSVLAILSFIFSSLCTAYWRLGPLEATCQTRVAELEMAPASQKAMLDTSKQK